MERRSNSKKNKPKQQSLLDLFPRKTNGLKLPLVISDVDEQKKEMLETSAASGSNIEPSLGYVVPKMAEEIDDFGGNFAQDAVPVSSTTATTPAPTAPTEVIEIDDNFPEVVTEILAKSSGTRREDPIVINSSPIKQSLRPAKEPSSKPVYSIFAPRTHREPSTSLLSPTKSRIFHLEAPFPDHSSQHVRGPQTTYIAPPTSLLPRQTSPCASSTSVPLQRIIQSPPDVESPPDSEGTFHVETSASHSSLLAHLTSIPTEHMQAHPVIAHLMQIASSTLETAEIVSEVHPHTARLWADKWHPTWANHVLGNEEQAGFLRQWLSALEVHFVTTSASHETDSSLSQSSASTAKGKGKSVKAKRGTKRPRVIRAVDKKPGRKRQRIDSEEEDDWIVYSDDLLEDETPLPSEIGVDEQETSSRSRLYRRPSPAPSTSLPKHTFHDRLTNTILLSGPHGSGKTAAVYACAEELGWEVFEVYPGVGKRSGVNLDHLVGEVGKNHLVRNTQHRSGDSGTKSKMDGPLKSVFLRAQEKKNDGGLKDSDSMSKFGFVEQTGDSQAEASTARQSLILLEEVDILFKEDAGFWTSLINLIKDCRRPVILTCNDVSLVPMSELPLQALLDFHPCSTPVATSFLQAMCCAEGYLLERRAASRFYDNPASLDDGSYQPDLRRAINCLQLELPVKKQGVRTAIFRSIRDKPEDLFFWDWPVDTQSPDAPSSEPRATYSIGCAEASHAEFISFADCYLLRNSKDTPEEMALNDTETNSADDVLGYCTLHATKTSFQGQFGDRDADGLIMSTAIELSRGACDGPRYSSAMDTTRGLFRSRVRYEELLKEFANHMLGRSQILRRPAFDQDYLPWIRQMVVADDLQEMRGDGIGGGRRTRNSQKYIRTIELDENARRGLDATRLGV